MTIVIDSGIWISALNFGGIPRTALEKAFLLGRIAICNGMIAEIADTLNAKMEWEPQRISTSLRIYLEDAVHIQITGKIAGVCRDPNDDMVIECAVEAGATVIVTGDKDLLSLRKYRGIRMLTAREFVEEFSRAES